MTRYRSQPPWEFLKTASRSSLQSFEMSRLGHAANLRKEITTLLDEWLEENSAAMLARWLMERREGTVHGEAEETANGAAAENEGESGSYNIFTDRARAKAIRRVGP